MTSPASTNAIASEESVPKALYGGAPYVLLAVSTALATFLPSSEPRPDPVWTISLVALAAAWLVWPVVVWMEWPRRRVAVLVFYVGLLVISAALVALHPSFTLFGALGYGYAISLLPPRLIIWGVAAMALLTTLAQTLQTQRTEPYVLAINLAVPLLFVGWYISRQSEKRNEIIADLASANTRLEAMMAENAGLHAQLVAQAREAGVLDERQRMAQEIHDTIAQGLAGIVTQLQAAEHSGDQAEVWRRHVTTAAQLARESLTDARRSVHAMRPEVLERSQLPEALGHVVEQWSELSKVPVEFTTVGPATALHPDIEVTLLRTAQEALSNVGKHADAERVNLTLSYIGDVVTLDVRDDGTGFDPSATRVADRDSGFGLAGMRQRLERVLGTLEIESEPGAGTVLSAGVPAIPPGDIHG
ncbi:sensor histidine kinase [Actinocrispum wychmicini]|uniref:Oxygen sensor histidine kinase NreB n=1 Tax=Actinocrispum wychmicini TaxID=1213861 RepID=A0A4R2IK29_9PSEU|nr:sensor histidine kinase [Actinocrispum wychmicini]TCO44772.1 signal transduction histidine kinase [Actinocrispum wychmicini]